MKKIRVCASALFALAAVIISERTDVFVICFVCALLHEAGHLLAAKLCRIKVSGIRIEMTGARICTEEEIRSYGDELLLCAAGPAVNVLIVACGILWLGGCGLSAMDVLERATAFLSGGDVGLQEALSFAVICSALHGAVNLLPIKTLDGGRMLYCLIAMLFTERAAQRTLDITGTVMALAIWSAALFLMIKASSGLGVYVFCACLFLGTLRDSELVKN